MKIDITTGDEITPGAIQYSYKTILDDDEIGVMAYNTETIIAEKYETIIRRNIGTSIISSHSDIVSNDSLFFAVHIREHRNIAIKRQSLLGSDYATMYKND